MHSYVDFGGRTNCLEYDINILCPECRRLAKIKISRSQDNPRRLFCKCIGCDEFIKWATPKEEGAEASSGGRNSCLEDNGLMSDVEIVVRDIKLIVKDMNAKLTFGLICMIVIIVILAMK